jgi:hypothetical protein
MVDARLRLCPPDEEERVRQCLPPDRVHQLDWMNCLAIDHSGGVGYVMAGTMFVHWEDEPGQLP